MNATIDDLRKSIVRTAHCAQEGHIPSALSVLDILWVLYHDILTYDPAKPASDGRDRFVLSKGHASLALYTILAQMGFFDQSELTRFCQFDGILGGHPDRTKVPGVETSTGSLGHGFPMGVGMAMALRIRNNPARVFVLIGDGEANEGTIWESALLASHHALTNVCCIVDFNHSTDRALSLGDLREKFRSFGWNAVEVDGHSHDELRSAMRRRADRKPVAVVARTIKGYGCACMEGNPAWHHRAPTDSELSAILAEMK